MANVTVVVGAQWGDEGKGKWIDILAKDTDLVARYQGGNNAGHTLYVEGKKIVLHQIPSGIFHGKKASALSAGVVVNPDKLVEEIAEVRQFTDVTPDNLWLSARAHVITPWSIYRDDQKEKNSSSPIGTTKRGIGPTYADKAARTGLRLGDYIHKTRRMRWVEAMSQSSELFRSHYKTQKDQWQPFHDAADVLAPFVCDAEARLRRALKAGKQLIMEGAQGVLLDLDHGTYPYVTSSATSAGGAFASLGFAPKLISNVYGIGKAYLTRVGEGPFPSELFCDSGRHLAKVGNEFGATTGRPRRCGWLDAVALRYSQEINGFDALILNKLDVLSGLPQVGLCVAYEHPELGRIEDFPWDLEVLAACKPIVEHFPGWSEDISQIKTWQELPEAAKAYIAQVEAHTGTSVAYVGTGVGKTDFVKKDL